MEFNSETLALIQQKAVELAFQIGPALLKAVLLLLVGQFVIQLLLKLLVRVTTKYNVDSALTSFFKSFSKAILWILLLISVATTLGMEMTAFVAFIGAAGLAIGFALQGSLSNFAGGILILVFKPFRVGDTIEAQGTLGTVEGIDILYTTVKNADNKLVTIPNGALANNSIVNFSVKSTRRVDMEVGVAYGTDLKKTRQIILDVLQKDNRVLAEPTPVVYFANFGDSSLDLKVRCWANTSDYWPVYFDSMEALKEAFETQGVEVPFPQRDVNHYYPEGKKD